MIEMKNYIKEKHEARAGRFEISSYVNDKPSYKKGDKAIWYDGVNAWMIGAIDNLGSTTGSLYAIDDFGGLTDTKNVWNFVDNGEWNTTKTNDITIECTIGTSKF